MKVCKKNWMGLMAVVCMVGSIFAADGVWTNTAGGNWSDAGNWDGGIIAGGVESSAYFTNSMLAESVVTLPAAGGAIGSVHGVYLFTLNKSGSGTFTLKDAAGFSGLWQLGGGTLEVLPEAPVTSTLNHVEVSSQTVLSVPTLGTSAVISNLTGRAELVKDGDGALIVGRTAGADTRITVENGSLTIASEAIPVQPVAGAWFHVDASDPASLILVNENGTNFVTQWRDIRTNGVNASAGAGAPRPFLRDDFQNGLPVVDFGSFNYPGEGVSGYGGYLNWSESCATVREVFMVFSDTPDTATLRSNLNSSFLLGHGSSYNFHRGFEGAILKMSAQTSNLRSGICSVDGETVPYSHQLESGFHLVSFATTGPVNASTFARDRKCSYGGQRLAEVIIYTNVLSASFRQGLQLHLLGKWKNQTRSVAQVRATGGSTITLVSGVMDIALLEGSGSVKASRIAADLLSPGDVAGQIGSLSITGDLDLNDGAVVTIDCGSSACDSIDVDGMLSIMGRGTFIFNGSVGTGEPAPVAVFTFDTVSDAENLVIWSVTGEVTAHYVVKPRIIGNQLVLMFLPKGTVILVS